jgi:15-hydroxyprostaglandin dehydrogenase (NAD)
MSNSSQQPVAIVTGGASGIGLALSRHLLSRDWIVAIADLAPSPPAELLDAPALMYRSVDVTSYTHLAAFFADTYETWGRLDLLVANAGIVDRQSLYQPFESKPLDMSNGLRFPERLDTKVLDVNLEAVVQGTWLFRHFVETQRQAAASSAAAAAREAMVIVLSSSSGIYSFPMRPLYSAAKHGLLGLVKSAAPVLKREGIAINALAPSFVATPLAAAETQGELSQAVLRGHWTPTDMVVKGFDLLLYGEESPFFAEGKVVDAQGSGVDDVEVMEGMHRRTTQGGKLTGQVLEVCVDEMFFRGTVGYPSAHQWSINEGWAEEIARRRKERSSKI